MATYSQILAQQNAQQEKLIHPALRALSAEVQPTKDRYASLLEQIKNKEATETTTATRDVQQNLEARGLIGGGLSNQLLTQKLQPISQFYTPQYGEIESQKTGALADINTRIAQTRLGAGQTASSSAFNLYDLQQRLAESAKNRAASMARSYSGGGKTPSYFNQAVSAAGSLRAGQETTGWLGRFPKLVAKYANVLSLQDIYRAYNASPAYKQFGSPQENAADIKALYKQTKGGGSISGGSGYGGL